MEDEKGKTEDERMPKNGRGYHCPYIRGVQYALGEPLCPLLSSLCDFCSAYTYSEHTGGAFCFFLCFAELDCSIKKLACLSNVKLSFYLLLLLAQ